MTFPNGSGVVQQIYIGQELYEVFNGFELADLSQMNKQEYYMDKSEMTEEYLYKNLSYQPNTLEEVERKMMYELLREAIKSLVPTQRRRLILYYFENFTYEQIAEIEGCSIRAIKYSVDCGKNNLKNILKKFCK